MYYRDLPFDYNAFPEGILTERQQALSQGMAALAGVERCATYREIVTDSWLDRDKFGSYTQKKYIDERMLPENEEGRYLCHFHLVALGGRIQTLPGREQPGSGHF